MSEAGRSSGSEVVEPPQRAVSRWVMGLAIVRPIAVVAATLLVYGLVPIHRETALVISGSAILSLVVVAVVFARRLGRLSSARYPVLAAVEALALVFGMFLTLFAFMYVSLSASDADAFSEVLDKVGGVYFSVTVLATVGFGDISPVSHEARVLVTLQMVLDLILIGVAVKLLTGTARQVVAERSARPGAAQPVIAAVSQRLAAGPQAAAPGDLAEQHAPTGRQEPPPTSPG